MHPRPGPLLLPGPSGTSPDPEGSWHCGIHVELKPLNCTVGVLAPGPESNDQSSSLYLTGASCVKLSTGESDLIWVRALPPIGRNKRSWEVDIMRKCDLHRETQACLSPEFSCEPVFRKGLGEKARGSRIRCRGMNHLSSSLISAVIDLETREHRVPGFKPHSEAWH